MHAVLPLPAGAGGSDSAGNTAVAVGSKWRNEGRVKLKHFSKILEALRPSVGGSTLLLYTKAMSAMIYS